MSKFIPCRFCGDDYFWNDGHECEGNRKPDQPIVDGFTECLEREYVNYCRKHPSKSIEFSMWQDAVNVGYAEGLKAGRADVAELIERMRTLGQAMPPNAISMEIQKALAAFNKGRGDGTA